MARMHQLADFMAGVRGRRKALVLFSEGVEYDIEESIGSSSGDFVVRETDETIAAATRGNVSIYAIDPRVVESIDDEMMQIGSSGLSDMGLGMPSLRRELQLAHAGLRYLAAGTGGFAALNQSSYARVFERIVEENSSYYLLGFSSSNSRREGKYRHIDVRVTRPGLRVRSRPSRVPRAASGANSHGRPHCARRRVHPVSGFSGPDQSVAAQWPADQAVCWHVSRVRAGHGGVVHRGGRQHP